MNPLPDYFAHLAAARPHEHAAAVDLNHTLLLLGTVLSAKPRDLLELGIGTGHITRTLLAGIGYNGVGTLTCVDSLYDLGGNLPDDTLRWVVAAARFVRSEEEPFVRSAPSAAYDLIVSDADHLRAHEWVDETLRLLRPGGSLFVHDADSDSYPGLRAYTRRAVELGLPHRLFNQSSRSDERCHRNGWLMCWKPAAPAA